MTKVKILLVLSLLVALIACAKTEVPQTVAKAFSARFPDAASVKWQKESENEFEAEFKINGKEMTASFDPQGNWLETESELGINELPEAITQALKDRFADYEVKEAAKIEKASGVSFEAELKKGDEKFDAIFSADGTLLEKKGKQEEKAEEEESREEMENEESSAQGLEAEESEAGEEMEENEESHEANESEEKEGDFLKEFDVAKTQLKTIGENDYFILKPGYQLTLTGTEGEDQVELVITVLAETKMIDGVETRIVEERESKAGELAEVSRNYFAIDPATKNVYYFGESVDIYREGKVVDHEGAWESGENGAKFGLMIPGNPQKDQKYYQEIAPKIAMDRAEVESLNESLQTPAGAFSNCLKIEETTPLEPGVKEYKFYAPGIGLIKDGGLLLSKYGFKK